MADSTSEKEKKTSKKATKSSKSGKKTTKKAGKAAKDGKKSPKKGKKTTKAGKKASKSTKDGKKAPKKASKTAKKSKKAPKKSTKKAKKVSKSRKKTPKKSTKVTKSEKKAPKSVKAASASEEAAVVSAAMAKTITEEAIKVEPEPPKAAKPVEEVNKDAHKNTLDAIKAAKKTVAPTEKAVEAKEKPTPPVSEASSTAAKATEVNQKRSEETSSAPKEASNDGVASVDAKLAASAAASAKSTPKRAASAPKRAKGESIITYQYQGAKRARRKKRRRAPGAAEEAPKKSNKYLERIRQAHKNFSEGVNARELAVFLDQLSLCLRCGLGHADALDALSQNQANKYLERIVKDLLDCVYSGLTLSQSMSRHPEAFPSTVVMLVRIGETSGNLEQQLRRAGDMLTKTNGFIDRIKSAIIGPVVTTLFCFIVLFAIVKSVFPKFLSMYQSMGIEFPAISKFVFVLVSTANHPLTMFVIIGSAIAGFIYRKEIQEKLFIFMLDFPLTRPIVGRVLCATTCETLGTLHNDGVPLHKILSLMSENGPFPVHLENLKEARKTLISSGSLHASLSTLDYFPSFFHNMVAIGEESGSLDDLLRSTQAMLESEIESLVDRVSSAMEPAVTVMMGVSMAILFIGMFLPIYQILNKLGS